MSLYKEIILNPYVQADLGEVNSIPVNSMKAGIPAHQEPLQNTDLQSILYRPMITCKEKDQ